MKIIINFKILSTLLIMIEFFIVEEFIRIILNDIPLTFYVLIIIVLFILFSAFLVIYFIDCNVDNIDITIFSFLQINISKNIFFKIKSNKLYREEQKILEQEKAFNILDEIKFEYIEKYVRRNKLKKLK